MNGYDALRESAAWIPVAGFQRFVLFSPAVFFLPTYAELQYSSAASPTAPAGAISEYVATIGSLSKISGV